MKAVQVPVVLFAILLFVTLSIESVFSFPVMTLLLFLVQQPTLTETESSILAIVCGVAVATLYQLPLAVGMAVVVGITIINRIHWWQTHTQTRDGLLVLFACTVIWVWLGHRVEPLPMIGFGLYYLVIIIGSRLLSHRRLLVPRR